ncbi:MAG: aspartate/glutamate racemase family protein [Ferruginibacter sp.]
MKTIGIIGGISWLSTADYYRLINEMINEKLGSVNAGKIILYSVNYEEIKLLTEAGRWDKMSEMLCDIAVKLETAGADCIMISANTMHKIADDIQQAINIPFIHIAEVVADAINKKQIKKVALLGTKYTMQLDFYRDKLSAKGIQTIIPDEKFIEPINTAIYKELGKGLFLPSTKTMFLEIIAELQLQGAEGIILGCTELPILLKQSDCSIPLFDTTLIHTKAAVEFSLQEGS